MQVMEATTRVGCKASIGSLWCDCGASEEDGLVGWEANVFGAIPASRCRNASPAYGVYGPWMRQVVPRLAFPSLAWLCNSPESQSMYRARTCLVPYGMASIWFSSIGANRRLPVGYVYVKSRTPIRMVPIVVPAAAVTGSNDRWAWSAFVAGGAQGSHLVCSIANSYRTKSVVLGATGCSLEQD